MTTRKPHSLRPYLSAQRVAELNRELGRRIHADYAPLVAAGEELLLVVTLKGAIFFAADLIREIGLPLRLDFVRLSSYGSGTTSSGTVRILKDIEHSPQGRHVLILDEIADTGRTLKFLMDRLSVTSPKSIRLVSLLNKPSRREVPIPLDYVGTEVEDKFLLGYGLDYGEIYRNLKEIYYLQEEVG